jgi:Na+-driven multidrug efflux pump
MVTLLVNVFCIAIVYGTVSVLETYVSQAMGAGNYRKCGVYLNKAILSTILFLIPITIVLLNTENLLLALH